MSRRAKHVCFYSKKCADSLQFLEDLSKLPAKNDFQFICVDPAPNRPKLPNWLEETPTLIIDGESKPLTREMIFNWLSLQRIMGAPSTGGYGSSNARVNIHTGEVIRDQRDDRFIEPPRPQMESRGPPTYDPNPFGKGQETRMPDNRYAPPAYDPTPPRPQQARTPEMMDTRRGGGGGGPQPPEPMATRPGPNQIAQQVAPPPQTEELNDYTPEFASGKWSDNYSFLDDQFSIEKGIGGSRIARNFAGLDGAALPQGGGNQQQYQQPPRQEVMSEKARALNSAFDNYMKQRDMDMPRPRDRI
jgi:hypothetical protein